MLEGPFSRENLRVLPSGQRSAKRSFLAKAARACRVETTGNTPRTGGSSFSWEYVRVNEVYGECLCLPMASRKANANGSLSSTTNASRLVQDTPAKIDELDTPAKIDTRIS